MIYGDNPNKINEREDALGLKAYTYAPSINSIMQSGNLYVYCGNNPISRIDPTGNEWWHWALGATVVVGCAVATVVTCGGFAAAATAVCMVGSGVAATTTASTVAASAFIGSSMAYGFAVLSAAGTSSSIDEFNEQGNWGTVAVTASGAVIGGTASYFSIKTSTTTLYRSVSSAEANDIKNTGKFNLSPTAMECKQFGFNFYETKQFGEHYGQNIIVQVRVPTNMIRDFCNVSVDSTIFKSGTLTVYAEQLEKFNQAVKGTIILMK